MEHSLWFLTSFLQIPVRLPVATKFSVKPKLRAEMRLTFCDFLLLGDSSLFSSCYSALGFRIIISQIRPASAFCHLCCAQLKIALS